jgi:alkylation response protein AidB-like acyl-CoA dehydrogenase
MTASALALSHAGSAEQRERLLGGVLAGERAGTVGLVRDGRAVLVPDAQGCDFAVLFGDEGAWLLERPSAEPVATIDMTRRFGALEPDGGGEPLDGDVAGARDRIALMVAAESVGVAQRMLEASVAYAKDRKQFGQPIGVHQAVSHACAQMFLETESARSSYLFAAWAADEQAESLPLAAASAKAYASDAGWRVTAAALQVHGGIGFTWEHDLQFFLKRARVNAQLFGSAREHRDRIADLIAV